jgi:hypothetical protein
LSISYGVEKCLPITEMFHVQGKNHADSAKIFRNFLSGNTIKDLKGIDQIFDEGASPNNHKKFS